MIATRVGAVGVDGDGLRCAAVTPIDRSRIGLCGGKAVPWVSPGATYTDWSQSHIDRAIRANNHRSDRRSFVAHAYGEGGGRGGAVGVGGGEVNSVSARGEPRSGRPIPRPGRADTAARLSHQSDVAGLLGNCHGIVVI